MICSGNLSDRLFETKPDRRDEVKVYNQTTTNPADNSKHNRHLPTLNGMMQRPHDNLPPIPSLAKLENPRPHSAIPRSATPCRVKSPCSPTVYAPHQQPNKPILAQ